MFKKIKEFFTKIKQKEKLEQDRAFLRHLAEINKKPSYKSFKILIL